MQVSTNFTLLMYFLGYATRNQSILSVANNPFWDPKDQNGNLYSIISYGNGPGYVNSTSKKNYTDEYFCKSTTITLSWNHESTEMMLCCYLL